MRGKSLHIYEDSAALAEGLAEWIAGDIARLLKTQERYSFVLSGGNTPKALYHVLAEEYKDSVEWGKVDFFWGDERYVPFDDERNNGRMAFETLLTPLKIAANNIHRMVTSPTPQEAAEKYDDVVRKYLKDKNDYSFDFTLLGMGDDGHTLSVFPGSELVDNQSDKIVATINKKTNLPRVTMLPALVNRSRSVAFMISGEGKRATFEKVLKGEFRPHQYPSQLIKPNPGQLLWFADKTAAGALLK